MDVIQIAAENVTILIIQSVYSAALESDFQKLTPAVIHVER